MARFCASCGAQMADNAAACPACGKAAAAGGGGAAPAASGGLADNMAGALAYVTIIPAIIFLVMEPYNRNKFIRFHAFQCLFMAAAGICIGIIAIIPILGWIVYIVGMLGLFVGWILCIVKAYGNEKFKLPIIGEFAEKQANAI
ncbi:MAG: hypothetical protein L0099_04330 [Acidobacteria bacterium]|nr:hypothetical protein [Acidobacteriota bacterium]